MLQIITDSAADITLAEAEQLRIHIVPLKITFPDGECPQETDEDFVTFYKRLAVCAELPVTSQPAPEAYLELFEAAEKVGDDVLVLTLSGGLSGTIQAANSAKALSDWKRIFIVDTHQAITSQRLMVERAVALRDQGLSVEEIVADMEEIRDRITVSGVVDTLTNLRKGGRIPASLAILGNALRIKPVIALQDTKLVAIGKVMGRNAGKRLLWERFEKHPPAEGSPIIFAYSTDPELGKEFMAETLDKFDTTGHEIRFLPVGGVIGTHVGNNCIAIAYIAKEEVHG